MSSSILNAPVVGPVDGRQSRYEWRGLHIDSARTCFALSTLKKVVDIAARYGFNRLHWHLTDDAGWRFEVPGYPRLIEVGANLPRDSFAHYTNAAEGTVEACVADQAERWRCGYYTDTEIRELVDYAHQAGITVVPEVDLPGHMLAAIAAYPELGRPEGVPLPRWARPDAKPPAAKLPAKNDLLWPNDAARDFVIAIVDRVVELFDSPVIHIGGDECAYHQWETDPGIGDWLQLRGLKTVPEIQKWFMDIATDRLHEHGREVAAWDEGCEIGIASDVLIFAWEAAPGIERALQSSNRFVFADARTLYLNHVDPTVVPPQRGMVPNLTVDDILCADWPAASHERCIGIQACLWTEFVLDEAALLSMLLPRLLAVAERIWNPDIDVESSREAIATEYQVLKESGFLAL